MVITKLMGGLGNQMFQFAAGKTLATRLNTSFFLDMDFLLDRTPRPNFVYRDYDLTIFKLKATRASANQLKSFLYVPENRVERYLKKLRNAISPHHYYRETHFHFDEKFRTLTGNVYMEGYWQSPRYFEEISEVIRNDFSFSSPIDERSESLKAQILASSSVCVNVRRSDFLTNSFHGVCDMKYFKPAIERMAAQVKDAHFFVFSDDPDWCVENFSFRYPFTFVGHDHAGSKFSTYLQLMASCKHFIIPNSSFAWWAVWLNRSNEKLVIGPKLWFNDLRWDTRDLIPADWIRIDN
jgi:hypothetical protein